MIMTINQPRFDALRDRIDQAYRMDEEECLSILLAEATLPTAYLAHVNAVATQLIAEMREHQKRQSNIDALLHHYDLSSEEGTALMCLAEALLRIPDKATQDKLISDKLSTVEWKDHLNTQHSFFINAATWSLLLTGKIYAPALDPAQTLKSSLTRALSRLGGALIRPVILQMMKAIGKQFVLGQDISSALSRSTELEKHGYRFSYDMLGEAARTAEDASRYFDAYSTAITAIAAVAKSTGPIENPGISIKLSALHPRYEFLQSERVMHELTPKLLALVQQARKLNINVTVDAEEADRLDLSLDIFATIFAHPSLADWEGLGLAVQAYQKRAFFVLDWLAELSRQHHKRTMIRLVKGAYWDTEIKLSQVQGQRDYPVFTRKEATDVCYLACAKKLLSQPQCFYPQFGTHNAYSVAAILEMAKQGEENGPKMETAPRIPSSFEFQCLHGMGRPLYDQIVDANAFHLPCRIYAPVGTHKDLVSYLVRRLLENGANSSFVNKLAHDDTVSIANLVRDPVARMAALPSKRHPRVPLPMALYGEWQNSLGIDLSDATEREKLQQQMQTAEKENWLASPIINGKMRVDSPAQEVTSPSDTGRVIGRVHSASEAAVEEAIRIAHQAEKTWGQTTVAERAAVFEHAAELLQQEMPSLIALLVEEAGRCIPDSLSEVREAIDYCRYYAYRARHDMAPVTLPGPTGETNQLSLHPRGTIVCISPWNFPLAIFTGQIVAALVTGNTVIAKPAEQTPLIAFKTVQLLHSAGVPKEALQLLLGPGAVVGAKLVSDTRIAGVMFTGSTQTAKFIEQSLANRLATSPGQAGGQHCLGTGGGNTAHLPIALFIAETGGQNAMIVDSSALAEQVVLDIVQSAFNSAGQRCSALRVLFVQEEMAPKLLPMLKGHVQELTIGHPGSFSTDIGPLIDAEAKQKMQTHMAKLHQQGRLLAQARIDTAIEGGPGHYFAPCVFEIPDLSILTGEVFGPILHVIRYRAHELDKVMNAIIHTGYGLTLGIHSRIDATVQYIAKRMPVGNIYVNRNMIGAVVGVQPFGGERLSGTGPKAGGPHYLPRLCMEGTVSNNITAIGGNARLISLLEDD